MKTNLYKAGLVLQEGEVYIVAVQLVRGAFPREVAGANDAYVHGSCLKGVAYKLLRVEERERDELLFTV